MFEYFPSNYVWNLGVNLAMGAGAAIGEVDEACRALRDAAYRNDDAAQEEWFQSWSKLAQRVEAQGRADALAGNELSAGRKLLRATLYYQNAERMAHPKDPRKKVAYRSLLDCFKTGARFRGEPIEWVEVPYRGASMPALFVPAEGGGKAPPAGKGERNHGLTTRELQVLQLICDGLTNRAIAEKLDLSANTVAVHRANMMQTLGLHKTAELVAYAMRHGLVNVL